MHAFSPLLRYFEEVAAQGSVRRAAERLHIAPSAVTRQVKAFEDLLGVPLFERLPRGVRLTSAGELMLASVRRLEREFDAALSQVDALKGLRRGKVRIGVLQTLTERAIPALVAQVRRAYPGISFTVYAGNSDDIAARIAAGELDIGLCWTPAPTAPLRRVRTVPVSIGLVVPAGHPWAKRKSLRFRECLDQPLILPMAEMELRRMLDNLQSGAVARLEPFLETNSIAAIRLLVLEGSGVAVMTRISVLHEIRARQLVHIPLSDRGIKSMHFSLLVPAERSLPIAAALLLEKLEAGFADYAGPG
jgi:DNA-binding transcriptional LysR family regulator